MRSTRSSAAQSSATLHVSHELIRSLRIEDSSFPSSLFLLLNFIEIVFEAIEPLLPQTPISIHEIGGFFEPPCFDTTRPSLCIAAARDEPRALEDFEVL